MIEIPAILMGAVEKINLHRQNLQHAIIKHNQKKEPKIFQVVVLSGEKSNNPFKGTAHGNPASNNSQEPIYFFSRVRSYINDDLEFPDPFTEPDLNMTKKLVNMHPIGFVMQDAQRSPQEGEIWSARYHKAGNKESIVLMERVGLSKSFLNLNEKDSLFQTFANNWKQETMGQFYNSGTPNLGGIPNAPGGSSSVTTKGHSGYPAPLRRYYVGNVPGWKNKQVYNGSIPQALLGVTGQGTVVIKDIIPGWNQLENAFNAHFGFQISVAGVASGIRSYDKQVRTKDRNKAAGTPEYAATPGRSRHGWGLAIDWKVCNLQGKRIWGKQRYRSATYKWMKEHAPRFGFHNPPWALEGAAGPDEPWHFEFIKLDSVIKKSPDDIGGGET
jgi:hypothetical protein